MVDEKTLGDFLDRERRELIRTSIISLLQVYKNLMNVVEWLDMEEAIDEIPEELEIINILDKKASELFDMGATLSPMTYTAKEKAQLMEIVEENIENPTMLINKLLTFREKVQ
jgi:hypothetical protein